MIARPHFTHMPASDTGGISVSQVTEWNNGKVGEILNTWLLAIQR